MLSSSIIIEVMKNFLKIKCLWIKRTVCESYSLDFYTYITIDRADMLLTNYICHSLRINEIDSVCIASI